MTYSGQGEQREETYTHKQTHIKGLGFRVCRTQYNAILFLQFITPSSQFVLRLSVLQSDAHMNKHSNKVDVRHTKS